MGWDGLTFGAVGGAAVLYALFAAATALPCFCAVAELCARDGQAAGRYATGNAAHCGEQAEDAGDRPTREARAA